VASGNASGYKPYVETVPQGKIYYTTNNLDPALKAAGVGAQTKAALDFMRANSPTFASAVDSRLSWKYGVAVVPIMGGGGTVNTNNNVVFGVNAGVRPDGSVVYPAYVIAHEFGHTYQAFDSAHPQWNVRSSSDMTSAQLRVAPNNAEYYAYNFAEQVSREVRQNTGVNIGTQSNYWDVGTTSGTYQGILPPKE